MKTRNMICLIINTKKFWTTTNASFALRWYLYHNYHILKLVTKRIEGEQKSSPKIVIFEFLMFHYNF